MSRPSLLIESNDSIIVQYNIISFILSSSRISNQEEIIQEKRKTLLFCIKVIVAIIFFFIVLGSATLNKLTVISLIGRMRSATFFFNSSTNEITPEKRQTTVTLYWYFQLVLLIPNCITFLRCLAFGVLGKTTKTFPWPTRKAIVSVSTQLCMP